MGHKKCFLTFQDAPELESLGIVVDSHVIEASVEAELVTAEQGKDSRLVEALLRVIFDEACLHKPVNEHFCSVRQKWKESRYHRSLIEETAEKYEREGSKSMDVEGRKKFKAFVLAICRGKKPPNDSAGKKRCSSGPLPRNTKGFKQMTLNQY